MGCWLTIYIIKDKDDPIVKYTRDNRWKGEKRLDYDDFKKVFAFDPVDYIDSLPHIEYKEYFDTRHNENFPDWPQEITSEFLSAIKREFMEADRLIEMLGDHIGEYVVGFYI